MQAGLTARRACRIMGLSTSMLAEPKPAAQDEQNQELQRRLREVLRPGLGYRMARALVLPAWNAEFGPLNTKRVHRVWRACQFSLSKKKGTKRRTGNTVPLAATRPNQVWCLDFCHDACLNGTVLKVLALKDEYTRECLALEVACGLNSFAVRRVVEAAIEEYGAPAFLRSDNGPEFIAGHLGVWLQTQGTQTRFIKPGSPWQNGHAESFMARLRAECLDAEVFLNLNDARLKLEVFRRYYNQCRPHSALGYIPPAQFALNLKQQTQQEGG